MNPLLTVENLVKYYSIRRGVLPRVVGYVKAVDGVSFSIGRGETFGLVGESGCGKTTLGRAILRLIEPTSGRIVFDGCDLLSLNAKQMRKLRREMQIIFQDPFDSLNPRMTVGSMIEEPILVHGIEEEDDKHGIHRSGSERRGAARKRVFELLDMVGLPRDAASRYPHEFSGGQRQRIGIARALALRPRFIVCDEAVSALDVSIQAQILNLLAELQRELGLTYLFIAHDLAVVKHITTRVAVMYLGEIVEEAATDETFIRPAHPYTQALLASIPIPIPSRRHASRRLAGDLPSPSNPPPGCRFHTRCPIAIDECSAAKPGLLPVFPDHKVACIRTEISLASTARQ